jgi:TIR domain-containing protein/PASTA domain-containing protein/papain like protease
MATIFISYRRSDSAGQAGRLYDHLGERFGADNVFMDVDTIDLGHDFKPALREAVGKCDIMLVVIGPDWLDATDPASGARRLENPNDWVATEIAEALTRNIAVIPVLVRGASLPPTDRLPTEIRGLVDRQAIALSDAQWRGGVNDLVERLEAVPRRREREMLASRVARIGVWRLSIAATVAVAAVAVSVWWFWPRTIEVPAVVGMSIADARAALDKVGLDQSDKYTVQEDSLDATAGHVLRQDPSPGALVPNRNAVRLVVARTPAPIDMSPFVRVRDVGSEGTIGATAMVVAMEVAFAKSDQLVSLSERYLYEKAKQHDELGKSSEGTWMTALIFVGEQFGVARSSLWPYQPGERTLPKGVTWEELDVDASGHKVVFNRLRKFDDIYAGLKSGRPILAMLPIGAEFETALAARTGEVVATAPRKTNLDASGVVVIVGFDPASRTLRFAHSWGEQWGDHGFGTMSLETAQLLIDMSNTWAVEVAAPTPSTA